jgi:hypothetical protein
MYSLVYVFYADRKSKMPATAMHRLTLDPMGKCSNAFFSETTNMIKTKLYMNVHWMVLYKLYVFCSDMKFKMAAMAGGGHLGFPIDIKNITFVEDLPMIIPGQFGLCFLCRSEIQDGCHRNT